MVMAETGSLTRTRMTSSTANVSRPRSGRTSRRYSYGTTSLPRRGTAEAIEGTIATARSKAIRFIFGAMNAAIPTLRNRGDEQCHASVKRCARRTPGIVRRVDPLGCKPDRLRDRAAPCPPARPCRQFALQFDALRARRQSRSRRRGTGRRGRRIDRERESKRAHRAPTAASRSSPSLAIPPGSS